MREYEVLARNEGFTRSREISAAMALKLHTVRGLRKLLWRISSSLSLSLSLAASKIELRARAIFFTRALCTHTRGRARKKVEHLKRCEPAPLLFVWLYFLPYYFASSPSSSLCESKKKREELCVRQCRKRPNCF